MRFGFKSRLLASALAFATAAVGVGGKAVAQTYVRPSKGASVVVFDTANPGATQLSAPYDMSSFVEAQFDAYITYPNGTVSNTFNVAGLGRYIKIQAVYDNVPTTTSVTYNVLGSDTPGGTFAPLNAPGASQIVMPQSGNGLSFTNAKLIMTPLPYSTTEYTRFSKGNTLVVANKILGAGSFFANTPVIDMRGYNSIAIAANADQLSCRWASNVLVYGGATPDDMRLLPTANAVHAVRYDTSYVVDVATNYIFVGGTNSYDLNYCSSNAQCAYGRSCVSNVCQCAADSECVTGMCTGGFCGGNTCKYTVTATPLPNSAPPGANGRNVTAFAAYSLPATGAVSQIGTYDYLPRLRIQNAGGFPVFCGPTRTSLYIELAGETADGDGGVFTLENYVGEWYCKAVGGLTGITVFAY